MNVTGRNVPFFNYPWVYKEHEEEILTAMKDVMSRGAFILQKDMEEFEEAVKKFITAKHVLGVADGTNALIIGLKAMGIGKDDEVIIPSHTYIASAASIHLVGATPVLVECGVDHMIDVTDIERAVTEKTKAIMPVQLNGRTADMDSIRSIANKHGLMIIEDSAQALGSKYKGQNAGTFGLVGTFSLYPAKLLGCFGDGGLVVTNDDAIAEQLSLWRDHGRNDAGEVVAWGTNCRLDNLQAAVLNVKFKYYEKDLERRREIAQIYNDALSPISDLILPAPPMEDSEHFDVYQNYEIESGQRNELKQFLSDNGVGTLIQFGAKAVHQHKELGFKNISLPFTEKVYERALMLPMNTSLSNDDVEYVCDQIKQFYGA